LRYWKDLSVSKKLYSVVGIMALLIATELFTLLFAMNTLSAVRSFVGGEGLWSKAQKTALRNLQSYALTRNPHYFEQYLENLKVPQGDRKAKLELFKPNFDYKVVEEGFMEGRIHRDDIPGLVKIIRRFHDVPRLHNALVVWDDADVLISEFMESATDLDNAIKANASPSVLQDHLAKIYEIDARLTEVEDRFSYILGESSRWLERVLMIMLIITICIVEGSGLILTFRFSQTLSKTLSELNSVAQEVGKRNFTQKATVHSKDELGQLASAINTMIEDLNNSLGQKEKAVSDSHLKTIFLANMSHEIRTPLGIILGFTELLKDPSISKDEREHYLNTIHRTGNNLLRIINDILDVSRVESGYIEVSVSKFKLAPFIENLATSLEVRAQENKNTLIFKAGGLLPEEIITDETRLHQILLNLINNALKFTEKGTVEVRYWIKDPYLHFEVSDSGPGIDAEGREKLFQLFSQVNATANRKFGGSGLGLVLSKRLANLLSGDVALKSTEVGKGSVFSVYVKLFDAETANHAPRITKKESNLDLELIKDKNILVVDDNIDNQLLIKFHLKKAQAQVHFANDGDEGIAKALTENPDLILMDIQMPNKDGYVATAELREKGFNKPIIALTANAMSEDRNRSLQAGCNDYLTKPIEAKNLYHVLSKYLKS
jgi:signal transduction histidine kinase